MVKRPKYSAEFKAQAVRLILEEGQQVREVANRLPLSPKTLEHWVRAAREGKNGLMKNNLNLSVCVTKTDDYAWNAIS